MERIPFYKPGIDQRDIDAVVSTLSSGWLARGPRVREFEEQFAAKVKAPLAVATSSCTSALYCALRSAGVRPGHAVVLPSLTFTGTAEAVRMVGAELVFADVGPAHLMIDANTIREAAQAYERETGLKVKAAIVVHYGGEIADVDDIIEYCEREKITVINDCAHCLEAKYLNADGTEKYVGELPGLSCFSFYPNKCITTGLGGMVTGSVDEGILNCRALVNHGITNSPLRPSWDYDVTAEGFNFNMSDLAAAIGISQLAKSETFHQHRKRIQSSYDAAFGCHSIVSPMTGHKANTESSIHLYVLALKKRRHLRKDILKDLLDRGINTSVHWRPLHRHPYYQLLAKQGTAHGFDLRKTDAVAPTIFSLPCYPSLTDGDIQHVIEAVNEVLDRSREE